MIAVNGQTEGQPLILQCSVTTIRDINSRVDLVWISNGIELRRVEGVSDKIMAGSLVVYTDYYIVSRLNIYDSNRVYVCKVIVNKIRPLSATSNFTLNVFDGKCTFNLRS